MTSASAVSGTTCKCLDSGTEGAVATLITVGQAQRLWKDRVQSRALAARRFQRGLCILHSLPTRPLPRNMDHPKVEEMLLYMTERVLSKGDGPLEVSLGTPALRDFSHVRCPAEKTMWRDKRDPRVLVPQSESSHPMQTQMKTL